ncbi:type IA DNA topoisomerase [Lignipirellula cremea]|uniref:DNA topoisomerase n=1 Tax=Lignipirellula cremea TaxID=2528010 RepID=A0A518DLV3_9BACT|nr:type IA DNA topoisomerase [Lignipirellula cremea]QDU92801.1 DNA topoisomerase 3 [Lignipirellula cremea]
MKVVLAEKPSVARDLAAHLRAASRRDGYFEGNGYQVTWALGHLVELQEPADYDPAFQAWSLETLPIVPEEFALKLRGDAGARKQFTVVKRLFRAATSLICATDAGREGELIFRYIQSFCDCTRKPTQRLWLSSLTPAAIDKAFRNLRPLSDYDPLYHAARCRSEADWIVGLNATRNYTVRFGSGGILWSLGRVQTPVLAMIAGRDDEIRTFRPQKFWELLTLYRDVRFRFTGDRFTKQDEAEALLANVRPHPLVIQKANSKPEQSLPPQLYDLTELQRDMNRRYGMSAASVLQGAQSLYEAKLISYPRTDSRYLGSEMKSEAQRIMQRLQTFKPQEVGKLNLQALPFNGRIINSQKVSDHHAIIPTGASPASLADRERKIFEAIVIRFIAAFYPPCIKEATTVDALAGKTPFRARGVRIVSPGWTELYPRKAKGKEADDAQPLPAFKPGESGPHKPWIQPGETTPPKHFTENTLLGAMDTAGKTVDDAELREALKEKGLGTPATRAAIIETLLNRKYLVRQAKNLEATDLGRYLIALVRDPQLKSPELTGEWESMLKRIETGKAAPEAFMQEIADYIRRILRSSEPLEIDEQKLGDCPQCGQPVIAGKRAFGCSAWRGGCTFVLEPAFGEVELDPRQVRALLQHGVLLEPIELGDGRKHQLSMTRTGALVEIPVPQGDEQSGGKRRGKKRTSRRSRAGDAEPGGTTPGGGRTRRAASGRARTSGSGTKRATSAKAGKTTRSRKSPQTDTAGGAEGGKKETASTALGLCPLCEAAVVEQPKSFCCSRWREGCPMTVWKTMSGKRISARTVKTLLRDGKTSVLKGFKSQAGQPFSAALVLVDGKVTFDFDH